MNENIKRPELLLPAGSKEKLDYAIHYGADAVYLGMVDFSLRAMRKGELITIDNLKECIELAHSMNKKVYLTLNIFAYDNDINKMIESSEKINEAKPDAILFSDFGVYNIIKQYMPDIPIHVSTQTNILNSEAVKFWRDLGAERVVLSRDLSLEQTFWAVFSPSGAIARLPIPGRKGRTSRPTDGWWPVANPSAIRWMEIQYEFRENQFDTASLSQLYSEDFPRDGFSPIGGVQLAGHKVKTDKTETFWPQDADWLIWEKNTNGVTRLCQMKGGRWSPVREVPRAPQTIVVDNDTETVHLLYNFAIDRAEIDGSLRRLASFLKAPQTAP